MDDAHQSKEATTHRATKVSKKVAPMSHEETVKLVQANHRRTISFVKEQQSGAIFKDSGC
jgi:hypothetical protein